MKDYAALNKALALVKEGYYVSPLAEGVKLPPKGHHGYKEATTNKAQVLDWFKENPVWNLSLNLKQSGLVVIDIDVHSSSKNGREALLKLAEQGFELPADTYIEKTPNNGLHYFFKANGPVKKVIDFKPGIDVISDFVVIAPSEINGVAYHPLGDKIMADIKQLPSWITNQLQADQASEQGLKHRPPRTKKYTGQLLDSLVTPIDAGNRNTALTSLCGSLLRTGAEPETVYALLVDTNERQIEPLPDKELNTIFKSILRREMGA